MKKIVIMLVTSLLLTTNVFAIDSKTDFSQEFMDACENQTWFIEEIEYLLNLEQKTLASITSVVDFKNITSIGIANKEISGSIPKAIGYLTNIENLYLTGNKLSGEIPDELYSLEKLSVIDVSHNSYSGEIPNEFANMKSLEILRLNDNNFSGEIKLLSTKLKLLDLSNNKLSGTVSFGSSSELQYLALSNNAFNLVDTDMSGYPKLEVLSLSNVNAVFDESIYDLSQLEVLDMGHNGMVGTITDDLSKLTKLKALALNDNELYGEIPYMDSIQFIDVANNNLNGVFPSLNASEVYVENNYFTGEYLSSIEYNYGNFVDGASTEQYKLYAHNEQQVFVDKSIDIYDMVKNMSTKTNAMGEKVMLPVEYYDVYITENNNVAIIPEEDVETINDDNIPTIAIERDNEGIYLTATHELLLPVTIEFMIKANENSNYSKLEIQLFTNEVEIPEPPEVVQPESGGDSVGGGTSGGDFGGGTTEEPSVEDQPKIVKYISGYLDGTFRPNNSITREEVVKAIVVALEVKLAYESKLEFTDLQEPRWSTVYIQTAYELGLIKGYTDGTFRPTDSITRSELASILVRIGANDYQKEYSGFSDVEANKWYYSSVVTAYETGLISGYTDGTFRPLDNITRLEAVVMINRMLGQSEQESNERNPFSDVSTSNWGYNEIIIATEV